jgi:thiol-disulfide isomerase/thioredoxin
MRLAVAGTLLVLISSSARATEVGKPASPFSLPSTAGKTVSLASLKGKVVVVDFWATWCVPCKKELPVLAKLAQRHQASGAPVVFVTINRDRERKNVDRYLKTAKLGALTVLLDPAGAVAEKYDLATMPTSVVVDPQGLVKHINSGFVPGDEKKLQAQIDALLR